jgi:glycosyltransferase involved in cell wall biosynthesis
MSEVSFVVISYNLRPFLAACLHSIAASAPLDSEVIVVDDGSSDGSADEAAAVLAELGWPDRVIRQLNQGPGAARNAGLQQASGRWVCFVDGDDVLDPTGFAALLSVARAHPQATVTGGFRYWHEDQAPGPVQLRAADTEGAVRAWPAPQGVLRLLQDGYFACWGMLIPREPLNRHLRGAALFPAGLIHEDVPATVRIMLAAREVVGVGQGVVCYRQRARSITHGATRTRLFDIPQAYRLAMDDLRAAEVGAAAERQLSALFAHELALAVRDVRRMPRAQARDILLRTREALCQTGWLGFWSAGDVRWKDKVDLLLLRCLPGLFCRFKLRG